MFYKIYLYGVLFVFVLNNFEVNAQRGNSCRTPNQEYATCISIYSCNHLLSAVQSRDAVQVRFLRESQCGYDSEPLVCCGARATYSRPSIQRPPTGQRQPSGQRQQPVAGRRVIGMGGAAVDPVAAGGNDNTRFRESSAIPDRPRCGQDFSEKIYGGVATQINELPWTVLLQYANSSGHRRFACAGSLINKRYVLTAAHCVTGDILTKVGRLVNVRVGEYNTESAVDCDGSLCNDPQDIGVEEILFHEGYDNENVHRYDDIALVRLSKAVTFTSFVQPICLPHINEAGNIGDRVTVAGWGRTESSSRSSVKLKVEIPLAQRTQCTRAFASAGIHLRSSQVCAGGQRGKDSCSGDSGGPLMKTVSGDPSTWYQEGIVSFGARCGTEGWPGIYTKVEHYLGWIHSNVRE